LGGREGAGGVGGGWAGGFCQLLLWGRGLGSRLTNPGVGFRLTQPGRAALAEMCAHVAGMLLARRLLLAPKPRPADDDPTQLQQSQGRTAAACRHPSHL
jgi:hypothetical protein